MIDKVSYSNKDYNKLLSLIIKIPSSPTFSKLETKTTSKNKTPYHLKESNSCQDNTTSYSLDKGFGSAPLKKKKIVQNNMNFTSKKEYFNNKIMNKLIKEKGSEDETFSSTRNSDSLRKGSKLENRMSYHNSSQLPIGSKALSKTTTNFRLNTSNNKLSESSSKLKLNTDTCKLSQIEYALSREVSRSTKNDRNREIELMGNTSKSKSIFNITTKSTGKFMINSSYKNSPLSTPKGSYGAGFTKPSNNTHKINIIKIQKNSNTVNNQQFLNNPKNAIIAK